ncbi:cryptochrome/photolyase family protein [Aliisedimentitalea scapharcae]|uniref:cryptochrome/photolyase family protein n=1 Tax=Aliisedimentitalea scapharcae TaxID=1524259 RepID=UPI003873BE8D
MCRITKKSAFLFSAMRHFSEELAAVGWRVRYLRLTDPENIRSLRGEVEAGVFCCLCCVSDERRLRPQIVSSTVA